MTVVPATGFELVTYRLQGLSGTKNSFLRSSKYKEVMQSFGVILG